MHVLRGGGIRPIGVCVWVGVVVAHLISLLKSLMTRISCAPEPWFNTCAVSS